jgi:hypothetical protein
MVGALLFIKREKNYTAGRHGDQQNKKNQHAGGPMPDVASVGISLNEIPLIIPHHEGNRNRARHNPSRRTKQLR